jgi:hypothetical protein
MSTHDAPRLQRRAAERQHLEQQPWPTNLFGEPASFAELMAESAHRGEEADGACSCGCRQEQDVEIWDNVPGVCMDTLLCSE